MKRKKVKRTFEFIRVISSKIFSDKIDSESAAVFNHKSASKVKHQNIKQKQRNNECIMKMVKSFVKKKEISTFNHDAINLSHKNRPC